MDCKDSFMRRITIEFYIREMCMRLHVGATALLSEIWTIGKTHVRAYFYLSARDCNVLIFLHLLEFICRIIC